MTKEEVLAAVQSLSDEDRRWVLNEITRKAILEMKDAMAKFREIFEQKPNRNDE